MKIKLWDNANKIMYYDAEKINDPKWNFGRLHNNIHCTTCVSVGKTDKHNTDIYTYDLIAIDSDLVFYVGDIEEGTIKLKGLNTNIEESLESFDSSDIEVLGSVLELKNIETD